MATSAIFGERYLSKVGAVFDSEEAARKAARKVTDETAVDSARVKVVEPHDAEAGRKLEPENLGIAYTLVKSHISLGVIGAVVGALVALVLVLSGIQAFADSPYYTFGVAAAFGAIGGMILGGLVSIRPDHDRVISEVRRAAREGRWSVVVHARDEAEKREVKNVLEDRSGEVRRTL